MSGANTLHHEPIFIDERVAVSPMPSREEIRRLARMFDVVIVATTPSELSYDIALWERYGVRVTWIEVPDLRAPPLLTTYRVLNYYVVKEPSNRVLIHCSGGKGRSGAIAAAYLIHRYKYMPSEAIKRVREKVKGAIETRAQEVFLKTYYEMLRLFNEEELNQTDITAHQFEWGHRGELHATYVAMHATRLFSQLRDKYLYVRLRDEHLKPLILASILHELYQYRLRIVEKYKDVVDDPRYSRILVDEELQARTLLSLIWRYRRMLVFDEEVRSIAACTAYYYRLRRDPIRDKGVCSEYVDVAAPLAAMLKIADALDHGLKQIVEDVVVRKRPSAFELEIQCIEDCEAEWRKAMEETWLLNKFAKGGHIKVSYRLIDLSAIIRELQGRR